MANFIGEEYDLEFRQGVTFKWSITIMDPDDSTQALDLTGYTIRSQAVSNYTDAVEAFEFTITVSAPTTGVALLSLTDEQTAAISKGKYKYDVEIESPGGEVAPLYYGRITVKAEATKYA